VASPSSDSMLNGLMGEFSLELSADPLSSGGGPAKDRGLLNEPCGMKLSLSDAEE